MKAFLLSAGKGTRLRPLTNTLPKCLMDIQGKPLLYIWLDHLIKHKVTDVLINISYLYEMVEDAVSKYYGKDKINIKLFYEETLLGSGGTVLTNKDFIEDDFFVLYADNLTDIDLTDLYITHKASKKLATMALYEVSNPKECGIATINLKNEITNFIEKPDNPTSNLANAGIYVFSRSILDMFEYKDGTVLDIGYDIIPLLVGNMLGYTKDFFNIDIGTIEKLETARKLWKK